MVEAIKKNKEIFVICILYGIISLILFGLMTKGNAIMGGDSAGYIASAKNLLSSAFFSGDGINADYFRTPGYPLFLAVIYMLEGNNTVVVIIQIILMALKIYLFYQILIMFKTPKRLSLLGSLLLLCNIQSYGYSFSILTEPLFGFLLMLSLYLLVKYLKDGKNTYVFLAFSISIHYAMFVRPILIYFNMLVCLVLLIVFILKKVQFKCFAFFTICFMIAFGGWSLRNYIHSGVFIFSTVQKINMQRYYAPIITDGNDYVKNHDLKEATEYHNETFLREYPEARDGSLNAAQISVLRGKYGSKFIKTHFKEYVMVNITGFCKMMFIPFQTTLLFKSTALSIKTIPVKIVQLLYLFYIFIIYIVYLIGLGISIKKRDVIQICIFLLCGYLAVPGAIFGFVRFRDPFFPLLLLSAISNSGIIIQWLSQRLRIPVLQHIEKYLLHEQDSGGKN